MPVVKEASGSLFPGIDDDGYHLEVHLTKAEIEHLDRCIEALQSNGYDPAMFKKRFERIFPDQEFTIRTAIDMQLAILKLEDLAKKELEQP